MEKIKRFAISITQAGVLKTHTHKETNIIRSLNKLSIIGVFISIVYIGIGQLYSTGFILFEILFLVLYASTIVFNYYNKTKYAKFLLIFTIILAMYIGTMLVGYERDFKFAVILPIALIIMFMNKKRYWIMYFFIILIITFLISNELIFYSKSKINDGFSEVNYIYKLFTFLIIILAFTLVQLLHINTVKEAELDLIHRINYEKIVSDFTANILSGDAEAINKVLRKLLEITHVSRVYVFENLDDPIEGICAKQTHEVCGPGIKQELDNPILQKVSYMKLGYSRWVEHFQKNKIICGNISDFPNSERDLLESQEIISILAIPIFEKRNWVGFIGFDEVKTERVWKNEDIHLLSTVANIIGLHRESVNQQQLILNRNQELKLINATKDKFFSIIAHDLRSPFSSILGFSEILKRKLERMEGEDTMKMLEQVELINNASKKTYNLLDNLLIWAQTQTGGIAFNPEKTDISETIEKNIELASLIAQVKQISIKNLSNKSSECFADRFMMNTVIRNLLTNAVKYTKVGGAIQIGYIKNTNGELVCFVQDNGIGMSDKKIQELFQIENSNSAYGTNGEKGSGLGLLICKEFIDKHNGNIWAESKLNIGSKFYFSIPCKNY